MTFIVSLQTLSLMFNDHLEALWSEYSPYLTERGSLTAFLVLLIFFGINCFYILVTGVPPIRTFGKAREEMLSNIPDEVDGTIYDLGAGWGSLATRLAKKYPKNKVVAYEVSLIPWVVCWLRSIFYRNLSGMNCGMICFNGFLF